MKNKKGKLHRSVIPFLFICPVIVMNLIFFCLPFLQSLAMSFFEWPLLGEKHLWDWETIRHCWRTISSGRRYSLQ